MPARQAWAARTAAWWTTRECCTSPTARTTACAASCRADGSAGFAAFGHVDLVARGVVLDLVHEGLDEEQAAPRHLSQVGRVGRVGQRRRVETKALVADGEGHVLASVAGGDEDAALAVRLQGAPLDRQAIVFL